MPSIQYHVVSDTGEKTELTARELFKLTQDTDSWLRFMSMAFGGEPALMQVTRQDGKSHHIRVAKDPIEHFA